MPKGVYMNIQMLKLSGIKPYENNPRKNNEAVKYVAQSIKEFGFKVPIIIDKNNVIIAGHTRYKAAKRLKMKEVPTIIADDLTDEQVKAFRLADNKVAEKAEWDFDLLPLEINNIVNIDMGAFGFDLDFNGGVEEQVQEDEFEIEPPKEPKAKLGDIYQLGRHRLMCGDSTDKATVELLMNGNKADMVLSDPPYGMFLDTDFSDIKGSMKSIGRKNHTKGNKYDKVIGDNEDFTPELITTFFENFAYCKEMFLFGADYFAEILPNKNEGSWLVWDKRKESQADAIGSEFELCWSKSKHKRRMLRHDWFGFLSSQNGADARNRVHPTQKPITLLVDIIEQWGNRCNNIVDLYGGSGSTLIACEQLNRNCYMMELDPKYIDVIIERWEQFTGEKAVLIESVEK
jgi:site-specific DNA-methyltransferase (adenine-specific)